MTVWLPCIATGTGAEVWTRRLAAGLEARGLRVQLDVVPQQFQYLPWAARLRPPPDCSVTIANSWSAAAFANSSPLITVVHHVVHDRALTPFKTPAQRLFHAAFVAPMERAALRRSARVLAVSQTTRQAIGAAFGYCGTATVLNGVDTAFFVPPASRPLAGDGPLKLLFVGKPSRRKGFDFVARLAARLGDSAQLTVIGPPAERGLTCAGATWLGRVSRARLLAAYQDADFLLLPSRVEGFGFAAAEAMSCGTPVLCAPCGAVQEIAAEAGVIADLTDPAATARHLIALRNDSERYRALRASARSIAAQSLGESRWLDEMAQLVRQVQTAAASASTLKVATAS